MTKEFLPAIPSNWLIRVAQEACRIQLAISNRIKVVEQDLLHFHKIPKGSGIILTSNHADETDPRVCMELSRRVNKRFIIMCNREAFDECLGIAKLFLQRLGAFSVKRGSHDKTAVNYAKEVVKQGEDVLLIFPEGEIYYLNERIQPFHSGAVDICLQAIVERRKEDPNWTAYIVPMAIKYHYDDSIEAELERRIAQMEQELSLKPGSAPLVDRVLEIQKTLLSKEESIYQIPEDVTTAKELTDELITAERAILEEVMEKHPELEVTSHGSTIDKAWQLEAELRKAIEAEKDATKKRKLQLDLIALREVAQLTSWHPNYYVKDPSPDRLAEVVMKLEREILRVQRPKQLASRTVAIKIAEPIDMSKHLDDYATDPHGVRHDVSQKLQDTIQNLVTQLVKHTK